MTCFAQLTLHFDHPMNEIQARNDAKETAHSYARASKYFDHYTAFKHAPITQ